MLFTNRINIIDNWIQVHNKGDILLKARIAIIDLSPCVTCLFFLQNSVTIFDPLLSSPRHSKSSAFCHSSLNSL